MNDFARSYFLLRIATVLIAAAATTANAQLPNTPGQGDRFDTTTSPTTNNGSQTANDGVACYDHKLRAAINAVQAYQVVYGPDWNSACDNNAASSQGPLNSCWGPLDQARALLVQAAQAFESARRASAEQNRQLIAQGNSLTLQAKALLETARSCFAPIFANRGRPQRSPSRPLNNNPPSNQNDRPYVPPENTNPGPSWNVPPAPYPLLAGVQDGSRACAIGFETAVNAATAFMRGDFVTAQRLLGIDQTDVATQFLVVLANDLTTPVATEKQSPYATGYRIARRICTYGLLWRPKGPRPALNEPATPTQTEPQLPSPANKPTWTPGLESGGAEVWNGEYHVDPFTGEKFQIMGRSRVPASHATSTYANKGESLAYQEARLTEGEIGLQAPAGANVPGVDFITAARSKARGLMEVIVTDVKTSMKGNYPQPKTTIPGKWQTEVLDSVCRLQLNNPALEAEIVDAVENIAFAYDSSM